MTDISVHISVSNQSLVQSTASLAIDLDGRTVMTEDLQTQSQHNYRFFDVKVRPGTHKLSARETKHGISTTREYEFKKETWIRVLHVYADSQKKHRFEIDFSEERIFIK